MGNYLLHGRPRHGGVVTLLRSLSRRYLFFSYIIPFLSFVSAGDCHWLGYSSRDTSAPVLPLQSEVTAGDFIGHDPISREIHSPNAPERAAEKILLSTKGGFIPRR